MTKKRAYEAEMEELKKIVNSTLSRLDNIIEKMILTDNARIKKVIEEKTMDNLCKMILEGIDELEKEMDTIDPPKTSTSNKNSVVVRKEKYNPGTPGDVALAQKIKSCTFSNKSVSGDELMDIARARIAARK